ncbi:MAG: TonB-dependent receptor [Bryobacterales bacterium]|nr:TonB-dependent receptor [Bryobacterales bacterium]
MSLVRPGVLCFYAFSAVLFGQATSQITGNITDKSGAAVADAEITVISASTNTERKVNSNEAGSFTVPFLSPDTYNISVSKLGFRQSRREGVRLEVNQVARLDFGLEVGAVSETVEVTGAAPLIESDTSSIGQVIEQKAIEDLPLNGRNFVQLAILGPGVVGVGFGAQGTIMSGTRPDDLRPGSELFSNGNRENSNNFLMDGVDNNERLTLSITLRPSVEAVREFKIQTNMFAADQGRNSGATVNVITKSGSNDWHGTAYEFLRNDKLDARNYFAPTNFNKPAFRQKQFGANLGGKIIPNKVFFFANYEGYRRRQERPSVGTVPTAAMRQGDFSGVRPIFDPVTTRATPGTASGYTRDRFPGDIIPQSRWDPLSVKFMNAYPLPQTSALTNNYTAILKDVQRWDQGDGRIDWNWNEKNQVFGRFSQQNTITTRPSTFPNVNLAGLSQPVSLGNEDTFAGDSYLRAYNAVASWVRTFTPTLIMEAKMGFNRFNLDFRQEGAVPGSKLGEQVGFKNANQGPQADGIPIISPGGYFGIGQTRSLPILRIQNTFNPRLDFTKLQGKHSLKFGFEIRRRQITQFQTNRGNGRFNYGRTFSDDPNNAASTGETMAAFLLGAPSLIEQDFTLVFPGFRYTEWAGYIQDDWKVTSKFTLNLGLRYEYDSPITEVANRMTNFDPVSAKLLIAGFNTDAATGIKADKNNFGPRLGFAYQARPSTVVRGGYGVFYNPPNSESVYMRRHRQLPFGPIVTPDINQFNPNFRKMSQGFDPIPVLDFNIVANNPTGAMLAVDPNLRSAYIQQYNFQVQQQLPKDLVAKIGYVGNIGRRLDFSWNYNQPVPGPGANNPRRPLYGIAPNVTDVTYLTFDGKANYNSLQASLERRFKAIGFVSSYTWSHAIDDVANAFGGADNGPIPQDRRCRQCDRGDSGFDIRHRFTTSMNWALPFGKGRKWSSGARALDTAFGGWDTNFIFTAQTGLPFTPALNSSVSNAGGSRPDRLKSGKIDNPDPFLWFDTSLGPNGAWGVPAIYTFGNGGRNILRGPGRINFDWSLFKDFSPSEKWRMQFRAEMFNLFNTPQFGTPNGAVGNPAAGRITSTVGPNRQVQLGLRFSF